MYNAKTGNLSSLNIRITNIWIIELGRILGKITKSKTFQIRPRKKKFIITVFVHHSHTHTQKKNTHHCRAVSLIESSILKFQNYQVNQLVNDRSFLEVEKKKRWLTNQPAPFPYTNFCASAHFLRNSSVAENSVAKLHSKKKILLLTSLVERKKKKKREEKKKNMDVFTPKPKRRVAESCIDLDTVEIS